jgi:ABC-type bacteriocin/lantibiotic exporter with double-glycine peptidase domain
MSATETITGFIIGLVLLVLIAILLRELACWYFKINERIELMKQQNKFLWELLNKDNPTK